MCLESNSEKVQKKRKENDLPVMEDPDLMTLCDSIPALGGINSREACDVAGGSLLMMTRARWTMNSDGRCIPGRSSVCNLRLTNNEGMLRVSLGNSRCILHMSSVFLSIRGLTNDKGMLGLSFGDSRRILHGSGALSICGLTKGDLKIYRL
jgi:hypothetical protein